MRLPWRVGRLLSSPQGLLLPYLALGVGTLSLSLAGMFIRWADAPGVVTGFYRLLFSTIILLPFFLSKSIPNIRLTGASILPPLVAGLFMAVNFSLWNTSLSFTSVANASMLGNISPLWVSFAAWWLFHERLRRKFWSGLSFIILGTILIMGINLVLHPRLGWGDLMAFSASILYAAYILITRFGRQNLDSLSYVWLTGASAAFWIWIIITVFRQPLLGYSAQTWLVFISATIVVQILGYLCLSFALGKLPASIVSPTLNLQPVITMVLAIPLLREIPTLIQVGGGLLILFGVYLINQSNQPSKNVHRPEIDSQYNTIEGRSL
jgi:drug/metabolite transporter (DMT)-like permease